MTGIARHGHNPGVGKTNGPRGIFADFVTKLARLTTKEGMTDEKIDKRMFCTKRIQLPPASSRGASVNMNAAVPFTRKNSRALPFPSGSEKRRALWKTGLPRSLIIPSRAESPIPRHNIKLFETGDALSTNGGVRAHVTCCSPSGWDGRHIENGKWCEQNGHKLLARNLREEHELWTTNATTLNTTEYKLQRARPTQCWIR